MALRVLVPLLGILAALAWGATVWVNGTTRSWFERDVALRARLVTNGAREALSTHLRSGDRKKLKAALDELARDDRIMGAAVCSPSMRTVVAVGATSSILSVTSRIRGALLAISPKSMGSRCSLSR